VNEKEEEGGREEEGRRNKCNGTLEPVMIIEL